MSRGGQLVGAWAVAALLMGCAEPPAPAQDTGDPDAADAPEVGVVDAAPDLPIETEPPPCVTEPTLASLQVNYFDKACASAACHGTATKGGLDLRPGASYDALVNVPANHFIAKAAGRIRVIPGNPDESFMVEKLEGPVSAGELMPNGLEGPLDPECRIAALRQWILDGALP